MDCPPGRNILSSRRSPVTVSGGSSVVNKIDISHITKKREINIQEKFKNFLFCFVILTMSMFIFCESWFSIKHDLDPPPPHPVHHPRLVPALSLCTAAPSREERLFRTAVHSSALSLSFFQMNSHEPLFDGSQYTEEVLCRNVCD